MTTITVSEARARLREVLERVKRGEEVHITQNGEVVAALIRPSQWRPRVRTPAIIAAEKLGEELDRARANPVPLNQLPELSAERAEELVRSIRAGRDGPDAWERAEAHYEAWRRSQVEPEPGS